MRTDKRDGQIGETKLRYVIVDQDGNAVSFISGDGVLPTAEDLAARNFSVVELNKEPDWGKEVWDPVTRTMVNAPREPDPVLNDRVEDIMGDLILIPSIAALSLTDQNAIRAILETNLPEEVRYYT
jgi:hypothetical protein